MSDTVFLTLLLTDLVDSTRLVSELGDARAAELMARHDRVARDLLAHHQGREIDKSDGFLLIFEAAADGVGYALDYHRALRALSAELGLGLAARAGLHTGPVRLVKNPPEDVARGAKPLEVEGIAKATAARVMTLALGGQTLLSAEARAALGEALEGRDGIRVVSHGPYRMKGVAEPIQLYEVGEAELAPLQPPVDGAKGYRVTWADGDWRPARELPRKLPAERERSFGRETDLRAIADAFSAGARLLTLIGSGGTGKTHLAVRYARAWLGDWPGGAVFCDLSEVTTTLGAVQALGRALDVPLEQGDPVDVIGAVVAHRGQLLVILDNLEQLVHVMPDLLARWMDRAPAAGWLVTSRQRLGLPGERLVGVDPLPLPAEGASLVALASSPAVQLFVDRATAVLPSFRLEANARDVASLVRMLDGLPLALELAAARVRVLPPKQIIERITRRFELLQGRRGGASRRQATLRGAIDWSWELLAPHERAALAQCAAFEGGFDLAAAEVVIDLSTWPDAPWSLDVLESLVDKSLVRAAPRDDGGAWFTLLRSIHEYAAEKLDDPACVPGRGARQAAERRHALHYARWGSAEILAAQHGADGVELRQKLKADLDNVVAATRRAAAWGEGDLAAALALGALAWLETSGPLSLADEVGRAALAAGPSQALAARLSVALGVIRNRAGQPEQAAALLVEAGVLSCCEGDQALEAAALAALGQGELQRGDLEPARERFEAALQLQRAAGDRRGEALSHAELAHVLGIRGGRIAEGMTHVEAALALFREQGDKGGEALARSYEGALHGISGRFVESRAAYAAARDLATRVGDRRTAGLAEGMIGVLCVLTGEYEAARAHFEAALQTQRAIGDRVNEAISAANYADVLTRLGELDAAAAQLHVAISIARENRDPLTEGQALGALGALLVKSGAVGEGRERMREGEARLREAGDPGELAKLLCKVGQIELSLGERAAAAARLEEARGLAAGLGLGEGAELSVAVAELGRAVEG